MSDGGAQARLWWTLAEFIGQPPPASLAASYREAIATARRAAPKEKPRRARQLAAQLAHIHDPPVAAWLAAMDPSHGHEISGALDVRVIAIATATTPAAHASALVAWCKHCIAAHLAPLPTLAPPPAWYARYDGLPWHALQAQLRRDAAWQLRDAASAEPGLVEGMASSLRGEDPAILRHAANVSPATFGGLPWPVSRRALLAAWRATTPTSLLGVAIAVVTTLPLAAEHRQWLCLRLPRAMLSSPGE